MEPQLEKRIHQFNFICVLFSSCFLIFAAAFAFTGLNGLALLSVTWFVGGCLLLFACHKRHYLLARMGLILWADLVGFVVCYSLGKETKFHTGYFVMIVTPLVLFTPSEKRYIVPLTLLAMVCHFCVEYLPSNLIPQTHLSPGVLIFIQLLITFTVFVVLYLNILYLHFSSEAGEKKLEASNSALHKVNDVLDNTLHQVRKTQEMLIQTSKMSALGEMAGGVAHEINNPLAIIHSTSEQAIEMIQDGTSDKSDLIRRFNTILQTSERISQIVKGLRFFASDSSQDAFVETGLLALVDQTLSLCASRFKAHGVTFNLKSSPEEVYIDCLPSQISQVLLNLLSNAFDAVQTLTEKWIELEIRNTPTEVVISITDSGSGIPEPIRQKLLQPFFTTKPIGKGAGLGLATAKGIVEAHNGKLWLDTSSAHTRFVIEIPLRQPTASATEAA